MSAPAAGRWDRRRFLGAVLAAPLVAPLLTAGCSQDDGSVSGSSEDDDVAGAEGATGSTRYPYADGQSQFGDLWLPGGEGPHPVVVLIHGGFWRTGFDLSLMDALAADVVAHGWAAWNVEYRKVGEEGGGWPGTFVDVAAAVDHLAVLGAADDSRTAVALDLDRVAVAGHSAGGHLAAWTAVRDGLPAGAPGADPTVSPVAVVSQAGVVDLRRAVDDDLGGGAAVGLMGASPDDEPDRYDLGSPIERVPTGVAVRCVHGRGDDIVPFDQSEGYVAAATEAGDEAVLAPFDGDHFPVLDPTHVSWTETLAWLRPFLDG